MKDAVVTCFLACIGAAIAVAAIAADATYLGTWKVSGATAETIAIVEATATTVAFRFLGN